MNDHAKLHAPVLEMADDFDRVSVGVEFPSVQPELASNGRPADLDVFHHDVCCPRRAGESPIVEALDVNGEARIELAVQDRGDYTDPAVRGGEDVALVGLGFRHAPPSLVHMTRTLAAQVAVWTVLAAGLSVFFKVLLAGA